MGTRKEGMWAEEGGHVPRRGRGHSGRGKGGEGMGGVHGGGGGEGG